jgi:hypothetical protein
MSLIEINPTPFEGIPQEKYPLTLFPEHLEDLKKSGLNEETILRTDLYSLNKEELEKALGYKLPKKENYTGLAFPYSKGFTRYKIFPPVVWKDGEKGVKYLQAKASGVHLYLPAGIQIQNDEPIYITEGEKKALKAFQEGFSCLGLGGIWNWKTNGEDKPIKELLSIPLMDREVYLVPDNDFVENPSVMLAVYRLGEELEKLGANVQVICLPASDEKVGLDDFLVAGEVLKELKTIKLTHKIFKKNGCHKKKKKGEEEKSEAYGENRLIESVLAEKKYCFQYNVVTGRLEFSRDGSEFRALESRDFSTIFCLVRQYEGLAKTPENVLKNFLESEFGSAPSNPVKDYFLGLQWDQKSRLSELVKILKPKDEKRAVSQISRWLVGLVSCALEEIVHENCLVLTGPQGVGKSRWLNNLLLKTSLNKYLLVTRNLNPDDKDSQMALTEKVLINLDELAALSRHEIESIKEIFSKPVVTYRRPYGHYMKDFPRRASFCGTTNNDRFLTDQTGNRRWQVIECPHSMDIESMEKLDYNQLWAEVMVMKKVGIRPWLNASEIEETNKENSFFEVKTMEEELIERHCLSSERSSEDSQPLSATEIASFLAEKEKLQMNNCLVRGVGVALSKLGYSKTRKRNGSKWTITLKKGI